MQLEKIFSQNLPADKIQEYVKNQLLELEDGFLLEEFCKYLQKPSLSYLLSEKISCSECNSSCKIIEARKLNWWIDCDTVDHRDYPETAHLCHSCRIKQNKIFSCGTKICIRCLRLGEYGKGKWCLGDERYGRFLDCASCGTICYKCHDRVHYNK